MPITVSPVPVSNIVGPGLSITLQSSVIGPMPTGSFWRFAITTDTEEINSGWQFAVTWTNMLQVVKPWQQGAGVTDYGAKQPRNGDTVHVIAQLVDGSSFGVTDSGSASATFDATAGLGMQIFQKPGTNAGFTSDDRSTMTNGLTDILNGVTAQIETATGIVQHTLGEIFSRQTLDRLTLEEITSGETFDPVSTTADFWYFGVIVRVTTIPDAYAPRLIDSDWRYPDLAVLRVFRGADLEFRKGIHTSTWLQPAPWGYNLQLVNILAFDTPPPETTVQVDWALGCGGRVFFMTWP